MGFSTSDEHALRRYAMSARASIGTVLARRKSAMAIERILRHAHYSSAQCIMAYLAAPGEIDMRALCSRARQDGKQIAYPIWDGQNGMIAAVADEAHMETDRYGMQEPSLSHADIVIPEELDLILVPGLSYDRRGQRLGWGGGQYEKFLPLCHNAFKMGVIFEEQMVDQVISQHPGKTVDAVATDADIYECGCEP